MTPEDTVDRLVFLLEAGDPFLHVRFGDGDVFFATGTGPTLTGDGEQWSEALSAALQVAWDHLADYPGEDLLIGDVESYAVSDGCEAQWLDMLSHLAERRNRPFELVHMEALRVSFGHAVPFYQAVANDPRRKVFVGPERLAGAAILLDAEHVTVPLAIAHKHTYETLIRIEAAVPELVLFAAGRAGKIMQGALAGNGNLTQIDVGSGLDILFDGVRRGTDIGADAHRLRTIYRTAGLRL